MLQRPPDRPRRTGPVAWLGLLLTHLRVRDEAWVRTDETHLAWWRDVLRRIEPAYAAAPASITAYAAYLSGNGALANVALDRADTADPDYAMSRLMRDIMRAAVPPSKARLALTPEALADTFDAPQGNLHPHTPQPHPRGAGASGTDLPEAV